MRDLSDNSVETILLSQYPLPYDKIGSWTTMYRNYLNNPHSINIVICKEPKEKIRSVKYYFVNENLPLKIKMKLAGNSKLGYLKALKKAIRENTGRMIIQIIDNSGLTLEVNKYLCATGRRRDFYLQHFYHGFPPFPEKSTVYNSIDELILLTHDSHQAIRAKYGELTCRVSVLHNGIDTAKFCNIDDHARQKLLQQFGFTGKKVFLWCANDRPKKGLDFILGVWKSVHEKHKETVLMIIGSERNDQIKGVQFLGKIPNDDLPQYYQITDAYLFPTFYEEGFGLSLIEAMHCGAFSIASAVGGVPEVLQYGALGRLIQDPHSEAEWEQAITDVIHENYNLPQIPQNLYSLQQWNAGMNAIINNAKTAFTK